MHMVDIYSPLSGPERVPTKVDSSVEGPRTRFCSAMAKDEELGELEYAPSIFRLSSLDHPLTSFCSIWFYGGISPSPDDALNTIHILSLPSFVWSVIALPPDSPHLRSATCHFHNSQLLILGGAPVSVSSILDFSASTSCSNTSLVQIFDTTTLEWKDQFSPNTTAYRRPKAVQETIDRNLNGSNVMPLDAYVGTGCGQGDRSVFSDENKLGPAQIAGIVVGSLLGAFLVFSIGWLVISACKDPGGSGSQGIVETEEGRVSEGMEMTEAGGAAVAGLDSKELERVAEREDRGSA